MDANAIITIATGVAGVAGGWLSGKRLGVNASIEAAVSLSELQQARIDALEASLGVKNQEVAELRERVEMLESLVTQRAEVEAVHAEVTGVRNVVDRIAIKVGA
jgi:hypothetical protein